MSELAVITEAVKLILAGELVAFPTETVYGLGANAFNQDAFIKIYQAKGRPSNNPLIVHVASLEQAEELAIFNKEAYLLSKLWPGPLTMVLPRRNSSRLAECVTAGLPTVAIRVPAHRVAYDLITQSKVPIAAPSANKSGYLSPTSHRHVKAGFKSENVFIIDSETTTKYGLESTIIDLSTSMPAVLRFGFITPQVIEQIIDKHVEIAMKSSTIKAPGMMYAHYAPKTPIRINAISLEEGEVGLNFGDSKLNAKGSLNLSPSGDLAIAAANLFDYLHRLDDYARANLLQRITIAPIPNESIGLAINDRLIRATLSK